MKNITAFILSMILLASCSGSLTQTVKETKIWDIYSDISYDNEDSYINNLQKKHPQEYRMVSWLKENRERAYDDYIDFLKSRTVENDQQIVLDPYCYAIEGKKEKHLQADLVGFYEDKKMAKPNNSPHGTVIGFVEALASGSIGQAQPLTEGSFSSQFAIRQSEIDYWNKLAQGNLYARSVVRSVEMPSDLKSATVSIVLLFFTPQDNPSDRVELVKVPKKYQIKLNEVSEWKIVKELL
jgi:hypothetical protein